MWDRDYQDYPEDAPFNKERRESNHGIIGCEMQERFGWGETHHKPPPPSGALSRFFALFCSSEEKK